MTLQAGTITGVSLIAGNVNGVGLRRAYLLTVSFPAYTGSSDSATITGVGAAIAAKTRKAGTNTMRADAAPTCVGAGVDTNGQAIYIGTCTVSSDALTFNLTDGNGNELTAATASQGVQLIVPVDQSLVD